MRNFEEDYSLKAYLDRGIRPNRAPVTMPTLGYSLHGVIRGDENLGGNFFSDVGNFFTEKVFKPVARTVSQISIKSIGRAVTKVAKYTGAATFDFYSAGTASGLRNKIFGLTGGEIKNFDVEAKVLRISAAVGAAVGTAIAGVPAIMSAGSKISAYVVAQYAALPTTAGLLLKDEAKGLLFKLAKDKGGNVTAQILERAQAPELFDSLTDGVGYPLDNEGDDSSTDQLPAGGGVLNPPASDDFSLTDTLPPGGGVLLPHREAPPAGLLVDPLKELVTGLIKAAPSVIPGLIAPILKTTQDKGRAPSAPPSAPSTDGYLPVPLLEPIQPLPEPGPSVIPGQPRVPYQEAGMGVFVFLGLAGALWAASRGKK